MTPTAARAPGSVPAAAGAEPPDDVDRLVSTMITLAERVHHGVQNSAALDSMVDLDLSVSQFRALLLLSQPGRLLAIHDLADELGLSLAAAGRCADRLVDLGLVERDTDPHDRRVKRVGLSRDGHEVLGRLEAEQRQTFRAFMAGLSAGTRRRLADTLTEILAQTEPTATSGCFGHLSTNEQEQRV